MWGRITYSPILLTTTAYALKMEKVCYRVNKLGKGEKKREESEIGLVWIATEGRVSPSRPTKSVDRICRSGMNEIGETSGFLALSCHESHRDSLRGGGGEGRVEVTSGAR